MIIIVLAFTILAFVCMLGLLGGAIVNLIDNKGFNNVFEVFLFVGVLFATFIIGMVVFTGGFNL